MQQEIDSVQRIERPQDAGIGRNPQDARDCDHYEPDHHDRPEQRRHLRRAARLSCEKNDQNHDGKRHDIFMKCRRRDIEALDRGEDRQGWRNDGIAVEKAGASDSQKSDKVPPSPLLSARSRMTTYFNVTTTISAHRISEITPITAARVTPWPEPVAASSATRTAYSGLVPISP